MLRRHRVEGRRPVSQVAETFGVSRQAFYVADQAFQEKGIPGLLLRPRTTEVSRSTLLAAGVA